MAEAPILMSEIEQLYHAAMNAEADWALAIGRAGIDRYSRASGEGEFEALYRAKVEAHIAFAVAAFPHRANGSN